MAFSEDAAKTQGYRRQFRQDSQYEYWTVYGFVTSLEDTTGIPSEGDRLDSGADTFASFRCTRPRKGGKKGAGYLVICEYVRAKQGYAAGSTGLEPYLQRATIQSPDRNRFKGQRVYAIPHSLMAGLETYYTPGIQVSATGTGTGTGVAGYVLLTATASTFTTAMTGYPIVVGSETTARRIIDVTGATTAHVSGATFAETTFSVYSPKFWPGKSGAFAPVMLTTSIEDDHPVIPGMSRVTCQYGTPSIRKFLEDTPGRGVLSGEAASNQVALKKEPKQGGLVIEGLDETGTNPVKWAVTRGTNISFCAGIKLFTVETIMSSLNLATWEAMEGKVNVAAMSNLNAAIGEVMFIGITFKTFLPFSSQWYVKLLFARDTGEPDAAGTGWVVEPWHCKSTPYERSVMRVQVTDDEGTPLGIYRYMPRWKANDVEADRLKYKKTADFSTINYCLGWMAYAS